MTAVARKRNVPGYIDGNGVFRPIRSASYVGSGSSRRRAKVSDRKKYSRAKAGDLGPAKQERALEDPWDRENRLEREAAAKRKREQDRIERQIAAEAFGDNASRKNRGKGQTLAQFIRSEGGLRRTFRHDGQKFRGKRSSWDSGEIDAFTAKESGTTGLTTSDPRRGKPIDLMWQAAREAGFDIDSSDEMLALLDAEISGGKKTYATSGYMKYNPANARKFDLPVGSSVLVHINGEVVAGKVVTHWRDQGQTNQLTVKFTSGRSEYTQHYSRKTGRQYGGSAMASIRKSFLELPKRNPASAAQLAKAAISVFDNDLDLDVDARDVRRLEKGTKRIARGKKKNPDALGMFANAAVGIASALQIKEMINRPTRRKAAPKRRGKTTAKRRNPVAGRSPHGSEGVKRNSTQSSLFKPSRLNVLTIRTGDKLDAVYLHEGKSGGFSKAFKTMAAAKAYATRNKVKLVENPSPKVNGAFSRALARAKAKREYGKELRAEAAAARARSRRQKAESKAKANPKTAHGFPETITENGKTYVRQEISKSRLKIQQWISNQTNYAPKNHFLIKENRYGFAGYRLRVTAQKRRNPKTTARRRTYEMFQGRPATKATPMQVSHHAPARLDALGDLIEIKLNGGPTYKFQRGVKLCAANGKLWIAGKRFAKPNPSAKLNEINPIGEIDHVVYGTYKPHHGDHNYTHYIHNLGEESGVMPTLCVDREGFPVIRGGNYKIEARGIVD